MSQLPPSACPQCGTHVNTGQYFCPNCGAGISPSLSQTTSSNSVANSYANRPNEIPQNSVYNPYPQYPAAPGNLSTPNNPAYPSYLSNPSNINNQPYSAIGSGQQEAYPEYNNSTPIPPPPTPTPYNAPSYTIPTVKRRRFPWVPVIITIAIIALIAGSAGIYALVNNLKNIATNTLNGNTVTVNTTTSQNIHLTVTYASDEITFTNIQQATKFADDSLTQYNFTGPKNYIRILFNEKQTSTSNAYFLYTTTFRLKFPNGNAVNGIKAEEDIGPEQGVQRPNWIDYPAPNDTVDLSTLSIILGTADEAQMTVPLKNDADVSQYQPKKYSLNSQCKYAGMDVTVQSATLSYYYNSKQAKSNQRFVSIRMSIDNNQDANIYLSPQDFLRLKTNSSVVPPDYSSDLNNFYVISPHTTGITGTAIFDVTPSPDGKYTLIFQKGDNINEVDLPMQLS